MNTKQPRGFRIAGTHQQNTKLLKSSKSNKTINDHINSSKILQIQAGTTKIKFNLAYSPLNKAKEFSLKTKERLYYKIPLINTNKTTQYH